MRPNSSPSAPPRHRPSLLPACVARAVPLNVNETRLHHPSRLRTNLERTSVRDRRLLGQTFTPVRKVGRRDSVRLRNGLIDLAPDGIGVRLRPRLQRLAREASIDVRQVRRHFRDAKRFGYLNGAQGAQFTSEAFTDVLKAHGVAISMDGKGRWIDNVFIERLWRSVKYEDIYLRAYETPAALRAGLTRYFDFYNTRRRHTALDRRTPDAVYFEQVAVNTAA